MKAKFFALAALVLGLASCQNDFNGVRGNASGEVDFQLKVDAAELGATRADQDGRNGHDSAFGAIDYLTEADWNNVDLRYSLEVYEVKNNVVTEVPVKDRMVQIVDKYTPVTFDLRLIPTREYRFVVFADFVPEDSTAEVEGKTLTRDLGGTSNTSEVGDAIIKHLTINRFSCFRNIPSSKMIDLINLLFVVFIFSSIYGSPSSTMYNCIRSYLFDH